MKKVLLLHGFCGTPNGNWKPWILSELEKLDIYAASIALPSPNSPVPGAWVDEIAHQVVMDPDADVYLVGHSLGATAILRYLESSDAKHISGAVLVSGPCMKNDNRSIDSFLEKPFNFPKIKSMADHFAIIHSDNDPYVPIENAQILSKELNGELTIVSGGGHFNSASGYFTFKEVLDSLKKMFG